MEIESIRDTVESLLDEQKRTNELLQSLIELLASDVIDEEEPTENLTHYMDGTPRV